MKNKVIVTAALAGAATMNEHNPNVPYSPEEFVREARRCEESGAALVHLHFREPHTGKPTTDAAIMAEAVQGIRENTHLILNLSTGVGKDATVDDRKRPIANHSPEMASLNSGSMNFCLVSHRDGRILIDYTYENKLELTRDFGELMRAKGIKPGLECFTQAHVHNALFFHEHYAFLPAPMHFSFVFGVMDGTRFDANMLSRFIHAIPPGSTWRDIGVGPFCYPVVMASAIFGGHVRVGLEVNLYVDPLTKTLAKGSWDQVEKAIEMVKLAGREPATPDEARQILSRPAQQ